MRPTAVLVALLAVVAGLGALTVAHTAAPPPAPIAPDQPRVKLAVLVVFDQLRGDYLEKWRGLFGKGGFARLQNDGAWFTHCHYPYGITTTGPGHASILTGTCPDRHGIVDNQWYERGALVYCGGSTRYQLVPPPPPPPPDPKNPRPTPPNAGNPDRLLAETVADVLRATRPGAKVFGLSLKDRSAILPTGKRPDGAYWFTGGRFVTSTYYDDRVHPWVAAFNGSKFADQWFGRDWTRLRTDIDYEAWSGPDLVEGEGGGVVQGFTFPHPTTGGKPKIGEKYYEALACSPFGNDLLAELAKRCVSAEGLGSDGVPDLLVVSFSSNDIVGHTWGPDSQEVLDMTLRTDALVADFLTFLDEKVGHGQYLLAVTSDHGVCPLVEVSQTRIDAKRVDLTQLRQRLEDELTARLGSPAKPKAGDKKPAWVESTQGPWLYFNPKVAAAAGTTRAKVARVAADFLAPHPDVYHAYTRADLAAGFPPDDLVGNRVRRSVWQPTGNLAERCGDLYVVLRPYSLAGKPTDLGTNHGTPFNYDTHVPLVVYGPGIPGGVRTEPTTPQAAAAIFSRWLGLRLPDKADFPLPAALERR
jgi:hypothetical protein